MQGTVSSPGGVEATIHNIGRLGKDGMKVTNEEIIKMMIEE